MTGVGRPIKNLEASGKKTVDHSMIVAGSRPAAWLVVGIVAIGIIPPVAAIGPERRSPRPRGDPPQGRAVDRAEPDAATDSSGV
jgi:hypothetical protein